MNKINFYFWDENKNPATDDQEILEVVNSYPIVDKNIGVSWFKFLKAEFKKPYFNRVILVGICCTDYMRNHDPLTHYIFSWTRLLSARGVKIPYSRLKIKCGVGLKHALSRKSKLLSWDKTRTITLDRPMVILLFQLPLKLKSSISF